jgi:tungstate transport system substrate-binding protein
MHRMRLVGTGSMIAVAMSVAAGCGDAPDEARIGDGDRGPSGSVILATTTSTQDSGLLDELLPAFHGGSGCRVKTVAVGSGEALALGESGDADVLLVHSPAAEREFMAAGHGASRSAVMHNDFVLVGPADDPAGVAGAKSATEALRRVAAAQATFASRADESGTHAKELQLWAGAGVEPAGDWYLETGQGMGETLTIADQKSAYTLADRGTFLATGNIGLQVLVEGGAELRNPYHVIVVQHRGTNAGCATKLARWLVADDTQERIAGFGVDEFGEPLFFPDARDTAD